MPARPNVTVASDEPLDVPCDALVVPCFAGDAGPDADSAALALNGELREVVLEAVRDSGFKGKAGQVVVIPTLGQARARAVAVAGLGDKRRAGSAQVRRAAAAAARRLSERSQIASTLHEAVDGSAEAATEGFLLGSYRFVAYKSDPHPSKLQQITLIGADGAAVERGRALADATILARDLANEPASTLTPTVLAERARATADVAGIECEVLDENELSAQGFGGIVAVGKGSSEPPRLIKMHYAPSNPGARVALVGKGVTFDSGGLSIKDARSMEEMKTDMSGGAAVIGVMSVLPRLRAPVEVHAYIPAVENMVSGNSIRPGDVIEHYGGRTTEVLNTDAEGRLILADSLALATESEPDAVVDIATLTGAMAVAMGNRATGFFATDDSFAAEIEVAAEAAGEVFWRMPLLDDYRKDLDSDVADAKNIASRYGGAIYAALFLQAFVKEGVPWAHLDIAGPGRADKDKEEITRGGTGVGTRTLIHWIEGRGR